MNYNNYVKELVYSERMDILTGMTEKYLSEIGIKYYAVRSMQRDSKQSSLISNCPAEWISHYAEKEYFSQDLVTQQLRTHSFFLWNSWQESNLVLQASKKYGLVKGISFALQNKSSVSYVTFVDSCLEKEFSEKFMRQKDLLNFFAPYLDSKIKIALEYERYNKILTPREKEIIHWTQLGKTSKEIAIILQISDRTIEVHLNNIYNRIKIDKNENRWSLDIRFIAD